MTKVDPPTKTITLADNDTIKYDSVFIATGGTPRFFWGDISKFKNVFQIRTLADSKGIEETLASLVAAGKDINLAIVGSSFIGMEAAAFLVSKVKSLTVIGMEKVPFERVLGERVGRVLQELHESKGVKFKMGATVKEFVQGLFLFFFFFFFFSSSCFFCCWCSPLFFPSQRTASAPASI